MAGEHSPVIECLRRAQAGTITPEEIQALSFDDRQLLATLIAYDIEYQARRRAVRSPAHRRAFALLRSFLNTDQQRMLTNSRCFHVRGSAGGLYRLHTCTGVVQRIERHGKRWYWCATFCLHDYADDAPDKKRIPLPDLALQQMLLLQTDEHEFLATANLSTSARRLWDSQWVRELHRARDERRRAEREHEQVQIAGVVIELAA